MPINSRSGLTVITTASPHNFELLKSLGADYTFDYVRLLSIPAYIPLITLKSTTQNVVIRFEL